MNCKLSKSLTICTSNNDSTIVAEPMIDDDVITAGNEYS